jgi:hypothetical protein
MSPRSLSSPVVNAAGVASTAGVSLRRRRPAPHRLHGPLWAHPVPRAPVGVGVDGERLPEQVDDLGVEAAVRIAKVGRAQGAGRRFKQSRPERWG